MKMATDLRVLDLEDDVDRYRAATDVLVRYKDFLTELIKTTIDTLDRDGADAARVALVAGVKSSMDFESELAKVVSAET